MQNDENWKPINAQFVYSFNVFFPADKETLMNADTRKGRNENKYVEVEIGKTLEPFADGFIAFKWVGEAYSPNQHI